MQGITTATGRCRLRATAAAALVASMGFWTLPATMAAAQTDSPRPGMAALAEVTPFMQAVAEAAAGDREIAAFYRANGYRPIWTGQTAEDVRRREALMSAMARAADHALPQERFEREMREAGLDRIETQRDLGRAEVALSRIFLSYAQAVHSGLVVPKSVDTEIVREVPLIDRAELLQSIASVPDPAPFLRSLAPRSPEYARLMRAKMELEALIARGGWGPQVPVRALKPGDSGDAVVALRNRLIAMGYMGRSLSASYDGTLQEAVQLFQIDYGLGTDGVAGPATIAEVNKEIEDRLPAIYVAMERERWMNIERGERYVWVNIPDFRVRMFDKGKLVYETISIVGKAVYHRMTPEFSDEMEYMEINPNWNVPRSIAVSEYLPRIIASGGAAARHLQIIDGRGNVVNRGRINYAAYSPRNFPFDLRQPPGPGNALGYVKFMFPNPYNIYLHDTPTKNLFNADKRDFSWGCVRLQRPYDFAYELLSKQVDDPETYFQAILDSGERTQVELETHVPVHIVYRTAYTSAKGRLLFRDDVYGRDAKIFDALKAAGVDLPAAGI